MILAELEIRHTRANLPTRRVALGRSWLPVDPPPGFAGILLAGIVASRAWELDDEQTVEFFRLLDDLETGRRFGQPRMRHRFQTDTVGLDRSTHRLIGEGDMVSFDLDGHGVAVPQLLGALYAAAALPAAARVPVFRLLRRAARWRGPLGPTFVQWLGAVDGEPVWRRHPGDRRWALAVLGFSAQDSPSRRAVQRRFRALVRAAHPDAGGDTDVAGERIDELSEARRILLEATPTEAGAPA